MFLILCLYCRVDIWNCLQCAEVLTTLIDWTMEGLNLDKAMAQPETAYKVRHLKMGIMMAGVLCTCDSYTSFRMLVSLNLQRVWTIPLLSCL